MKLLSILDIENIKRRAKDLKKELPGYSHSQLLNLTSSKVSGIDNFHEATQAHKKYIDSFLTFKEHGLCECSLCGLNFINELEEDREFHLERHKQYELIEKNLGFKPSNHQGQEDMKSQGYSELHEESIDIQLNGALKIIRGHYDRSLEAAMHGNYWRQHPSFETYLSIIDVASYKPSFTDEIVDLITQKYGRKKQEIPAGRTNWYVNR